jgi:hypothetical protein
MTPESDCPVIVLASGQTLKMRSVKLYEEDKVNEIVSDRAAAAKSLGGISTGIGFWGSPSWALGGAAALGIVEGLLSNSMRKQGIELLRNAERKFQEMAKGAMYFDALKLMNSEVPHPQAWSAALITERRFDLSQLSYLAKSNLLSQHNKTQSDITEINGLPCVLVRTVRQYVHNGDEFVSINTPIGTINIRWSHVVGYFPPQTVAKGA